MTKKQHSGSLKTFVQKCVNFAYLSINLLKFNAFNLHTTRNHHELSEFNYLKRRF